MNTLGCPNGRMPHKSQDNFCVGSKIAQYLIETLLFQLLSLLSGPFALLYFDFAFVSALALKISRELRKINVQLVAIVAHPFLDIVHPEIVHVLHFVCNE